MKTITKDGFTIPGYSGGIIGAFKQIFLLDLIVHKELRVRYRGSLLGMLWSYAKPATQFLVFFFAIGVFMGMNRNIHNYVVYMFSGVVIANYFNEIFGNATKILVGNKELVRKIYMERILFPLSTVWVAFVHFIPQIVILVMGSLLYGWRPGLENFAAVLMAILIVTIFALGLGLFAGALNVMYRDAENFVELILMVVTWASPVLYMWSMVRDVFSDGLSGLWYLYLANPITIAVELFHEGFWQPTRGVAVEGLPHLWLWSLVALGISFVTLAIGNAVFKHYDGRFAQEL